MEHIAKSLKTLIKKQGLEKGLNQQKALEVWGEVVGQKIREKTEPDSVEFGVLTVKTPSSTWNQELELQKHDIIHAINKKLNKKTIKDIKKNSNQSTILFAPACSSYDQYKNFEERGIHFNNLIKNYIN